MARRIDETQPKKCTMCGVVKDACEFGKATKRKDGSFGLLSACRSCRTKKSREYFLANPEVRNRAKRKYQKKRDAARRHDPVARMKAKLYRSIGAARKDGHTPCIATVDELLASFTGKCFVCGVPEEECTQKLNMDHDHETGEFRGWLCGKCNKAVGLLGDGPELVERLLAYLKKAEVVSDG